MPVPAACYAWRVHKSSVRLGAEVSPPRAGPPRAQLLAAILVIFLLCPARLATAQVTEAPATAQTAPGQAPVVGGMALEASTAAGWPVYSDLAVPREVLAEASSVFERALAEVPRLTGLPPFRTPLAVFLLADRERFRLALAELAQVPVELLGPTISGYAVERGGTMLIFLTSDTVVRPEDATYEFTHELAHLAVREASGGRAVPQWFNEGYAEWVSRAPLHQRFPTEAATQDALDRAVVASALLSRDALLPWSDLVNRARFTQAGREGLVTLSYGQSTLFINWLAERHGRAALAAFLLEIGRGSLATEAFGSAFGPFFPQAEAFAGSVAHLPAEYGQGLHRLTPEIVPGGRVSFAVVGAQPGEPAVVESDDSSGPQRRERIIDAAGFLYVELFVPPTGQPAGLRVQVTTPSLGRLQAGSEEATWVRPAPGATAAPVQLPRRVRLWPRVPAATWRAASAA
jgi:hypothetical protein